MKKIIIWIIALVVCAALMAGVYALYNSLAKDFRPDVPVLPTIPQQGESDTREETEEPDGSETPEPETNTDLTETNSPDSDAPESDAPESDTPESEGQVSEYLAPDFTVYDADGNAVNLSDYFGKPIVLNFWATWCYYCKVEMPDFDEIAKKYPDVKFLMVNATGTNGETVETAKKYIAENGFEFDVLYDTEQDALYTYGVSSFPTTFFIASNGDLYTYYSGALDGETLEYIIEKVKEYNS